MREVLIINRLTADFVVRGGGTMVACESSPYGGDGWLNPCTSDEQPHQAQTNQSHFGQGRLLKPPTAHSTKVFYIVYLCSCFMTLK